MPTGAYNVADAKPIGQFRLSDATPVPAPDGSQGTWIDHGLAGMEWHPASGASELHRPDNSFMGVPPELAVVSGLGLGRAVAGASGVAGKIAAGAKEAVAQTAPVLKYEATKAALEHIGLPPLVAMPIAMAISGYRGNGKAAAASADAIAAKAASAVPEAATVAGVAPEAEAAASVARPASSLATPAPAGGPGAPQSAQISPAAPAPSLPARQVMSPQRIQNELGLAARRAKVRLSEPEYAQAAELVAQGQTPMEAVTAIGTQPPPTPIAGPAPPAKLKLSAAETQEYTRLVRRGNTHAEAVQMLEQQRALAKMFGSPSPETVRQAVAERNATGRWKKPE